MVITEPLWVASEPELNHRVRKMQHDRRVFFLGDAAHGLSQWMSVSLNLGFEEAHILAWKLRMVCKERTDESILRSYHEERMPVVQKQREFDARAHRFARSRSRLKRWWQQCVLSYWLHRRPKRRDLFFQMAGLQTVYTKSCMLRQRNVWGAFQRSLKTGERMLDGLLEQSRTRERHGLSALRQGHLHVLCLFSGSLPDPGLETNLLTIASSLSEELGDRLKILVIFSESALQTVQSQHEKVWKDRATACIWLPASKSVRRFSFDPTVTLVF